MSSRIPIISVAAALGAGFLGFVAPASAQTAMQVCSTKYQAAKTANTLNGATWQAFRAQCRADAAAPAATPVAAPAAPAAPVVVAPKPPVVAAPIAPKPPVVAAPVAPVAAPVAGSAVFPAAIAPAYASLSAGVGRRKTCDDQYNANKATNGNGGLKWIQKGGGYYSECNKKLKGV